MYKQLDIRYGMTLVGVDGVGRNSLVSRIMTNEFEGKSTNTRTKNIDGHSCRFISPGKGKSRPVERFGMHVRIIDCVIFMYAVTSRHSLDELSIIADELKHIGENAPRILIGNKIDIQEEREVSYDEGMTMARSLKCSEFYEISAKEDNQDALIDIIRTLIQEAEYKKDELIAKIKRPPVRTIEMEPKQKSIITQLTSDQDSDSIHTTTADNEPNGKKSKGFISSILGLF